MDAWKPVVELNRNVESVLCVMKILVLINGFIDTPSSRLRWLNYRDDFIESGVDFEVEQINRYVKKKCLLYRDIPAADIIVIQKSMLAPGVLSAFSEKAKMLVLDIDDAIWMSHSSERSPLKRLKNRAIKFFLTRNLPAYHRVIVSCDSIRDFVSRYNDNVTCLATSPTDDFPQVEDISKLESMFEGKFIIGWTGTGSNLSYLNIIKDYIRDFVVDNDDVRLVVISDRKYRTGDCPFDGKVINLEWGLGNESSYLDFFDVGIMPMSKDQWTIYKCAYKLIYYMKKGLANISTDWGYQRTFITNKKNGYLVDNNTEWEKALRALYYDRKHMKDMQVEAFNCYRKRFSKEAVFRSYKEIFGCP
jgi:hypothetical protein